MAPQKPWSGLMPARRRMYPDRAPATGLSGTRAAYDSCARPGCGHARVKHLTSGPCVNLVTWPPGDDRNWAGTGYGPCSCTGFSESEE